MKLLKFQDPVVVSKCLYVT